ncbi:MAG: histidine--tRNA ligase [Anaerolineae bacterium]|nr:histidine--tRNA ligase [Anaerolineae bacterium]MDW8102079.1 histidine--tRNA ligase [Anaerolineae bacterium]
MLYKAPRGTQDILPQEQPYWIHVRNTALRLLHLYGYQPIDVPIFEDTRLFVRSVGETTDIVEKEMYTFLDKGGDSLTLRPEFTAGVVRAYIEHGMHLWPQPVRLYSIGPAFRYERPQAGRFRQFHQINVEALGEGDPALDFEVMSLAWQLYEELGFKGLSFQVNSTGCPICRPSYVAALKDYYKDKISSICEDCQRRLERNPLRLLDCKNEQCQPFIAEAPKMMDFLCDECASHFRTLLGYLDMEGHPYTLNHRLVRGLDYYTKTVFEVWAEGIGAQNAVCGGGRYDGLAQELGGPPTPGVGFAAGIERIVMIMKHQGIKVQPIEGPKVFIAFANETLKKEAVKLTSRLRRFGIAATHALGDRSLKAQLRRADKAGVLYTVIIGEEELARGNVSVRNMSDGTQREVRIEELNQWLEEALSRFPVFVP